MRTVVEAKGLSKRLGDRLVVNQINFEVSKGECFGMLGPNGAGKSSTLKMMYCSSEVTHGELYILGLNVKNNPREIKSRIGVIPQEDSLDHEFTVLENLLIYASYFNLDQMIAQKRAADLIRMVHLEDKQDSPISSLSGGMKRRLSIARGMMNQPELLFLDEPTSGLDPQARLWIWDFLKSIKEEMGTVVLTTHYMEEAEALCDRIAIMDDGKILAMGSPQELILKHAGKEVVEFECESKDIQYYVNRLKEKNLDYNMIRKTMTVFLPQPDQGHPVVDMVSSPKLTVRKPSLNDVFLKLAGHDLREDIAL